MESLEKSGNDTKSKRQIQFIDFMPDHLAPYTKLLTNYKPYDAFIYSNAEQSLGDTKTFNPKCMQCNRCSQQQNNAGSSEALSTVASSNPVRQNNPSNSNVIRWLLMYVPNPFVDVPRAFNTQSIPAVVNATRVNSVLLGGTTFTGKLNLRKPLVGVIKEFVVNDADVNVVEEPQRSKNKKTLTMENP